MTGPHVSSLLHAIVSSKIRNNPYRRHHAYPSPHQHHHRVSEYRWRWFEFNWAMGRSARCFLRWFFSCRFAVSLRLWLWLNMFRKMWWLKMFRFFTFGNLSRKTQSFRHSGLAALAMSDAWCIIGLFGSVSPLVVTFSCWLHGPAR